MGQRGVVLSAVARILNAGGSRLVDIYDKMTSLKAGSLPRGEKGMLKARLRECEARLERAYIDIGSDVALNEPRGPISAAREAAIARAAEYRAEMATLTKRLQDVEREQQAARDAALVTPRIKVERAAGRESLAVHAPEVAETPGAPEAVEPLEAPSPAVPSEFAEAVEQSGALEPVEPSESAQALERSDAPEGSEARAPMPEEHVSEDAVVAEAGFIAAAADTRTFAVANVEIRAAETDTRSER